MIRNYVVGQDWVLTTYGAGSNFYQGNFADATGGTEAPSFIRDSSDYEADDPKREAERKLGRALRPSEVSRYWSGQTWKMIAADPARFVKLIAKKFFLFWNRYEISGNLNYNFMKKESVILRLIPLQFGIIASFGLWGVWLRRKSWREDLFLHLCLVIYMISIVLFHIEGRYRLPIVSILLVFSGAAIGKTWEWWRQGARSWMFFVPLFLLLLGTNFTGFSLVPVRSYSREYIAMSIYEAEQGNWQVAEARAHEAIEASPDNSHAIGQLVNIYQQTGRLDEAMKVLRGSLGSKRESRQNDSLLAQLLIQQNHWGEAEGVLKRILMVYPYDEAALSQLATMYFRAKKYEMAIEYFEKVVHAVPRNKHVAFNNLGLSYWKMARVNDAEQYYLLSIRSNPSYAKPHYNLGLIRLSGGQRYQAREAFSRALFLDPTYVKAQERLEQLNAEMFSDPN